MSNGPPGDDAAQQRVSRSADFTLPVELFQLTATPNKNDREEQVELLSRELQQAGHSRTSALQVADRLVGEAKLQAFLEADTAGLLTPELAHANWDVVSGAVKHLARTARDRAQKTYGPYSQAAKELRSLLCRLVGVNEHGDPFGMVLLPDSLRVEIPHMWRRAINAVVLTVETDRPLRYDRKYFTDYELERTALGPLGPTKLRGSQVRQSHLCLTPYPAGIWEGPIQDNKNPYGAIRRNAANSQAHQRTDRSCATERRHGSALPGCSTRPSSNRAPACR